MDEKVLLGILVTLFPGLLGQKLPKEPERKFQFNCWEDICSFPVQYCDTFQKRCQYCNDDICTSAQKIPEQCLSYCDSLTSTTSSSTLSVSSTTSSKDVKMGTSTDDSEILICGGIQWILWLIFFVLIALFLLVASLFVCYVCHERKKRRRDHGSTKRGKRVTNPTSQDDEPLIAKHQTSVMLLYPPEQRDVGLGGIQDSPNGRTGPTENLGNHELLRNSSDSSISASPSSTLPSNFTSQPTKEGEQGPSKHMGDYCLLSQTESEPTISTDGQTSRSSSDSGYPDNDSRSGRTMLQKVVDPLIQVQIPQLPTQTEETDMKWP